MPPKKNSFFRVEPKANQKPIINFLRENEISVIIGNAGTGKDFNCLYRGLDALNSNEHSELILLKPVVEVGRSIGYLKGDEDDKLAPYKKSFEDNIIKMIGKPNFNRLSKKIHFDLVNFLRGNTFEYSTVILSEAQNCTLHELITVVTRLASNSKLFINGDLEQSDIGNKSGLKDFIEIIKDVDGVGVEELGDEHQVRNKMIIEITKNYKNFRNDSNR